MNEIAQKYVDRLNSIGEGDSEAAHSLADNLLIEFLEEIGQNEVADAWEDACNRVGFWYA